MTIFAVQLNWDGKGNLSRRTNKMSIQLVDRDLGRKFRFNSLKLIKLKLKLEIIQGVFHTIINYSRYFIGY